MLTTDGHKLSRGLSATAELLVMYGCEIWATTTKYLRSRVDAFDRLRGHYTRGCRLYLPLSNAEVTLPPGH